MTAPLLDPSFLHRLEQLELASRRVFAGKMKGDRLSRRKGQSVEFADYRNYTVGDDLRFLDWNLLARLDRLFIRLFLEEEDLRLTVLIDTSLSMDFGTPSKLLFAKQIAAAIGFVGLVNLDRVVVEAFSDRIVQSMPPQRGRKCLWRMLEFLNQLQPGGPGDFAKSMRSFALKTPGQGVVVVVSDFLDKAGFEEALRYLVARRLDVYVIQVLCPEETDPGVVGDLKLIDAEDGDEAEITVSKPLLERYQRNLDSFRGALANFCSRRGMTYLFAPTTTPFEQLVLSHFRRRGMFK